MLDNQFYDMKIFVLRPLLYVPVLVNIIAETHESGNSHQQGGFASTSVERHEIMLGSRHP
jgi:hypothetical protein